MKLKLQLISIFLLLTILCSCSVKADNKDNAIDKDEGEQIEENIPKEEENVEATNLDNELADDTEKTEVNPLEEIDLSLNPNELGEVMILMYHSIDEPESDWTRTPENFRKDLEYLYQNGYRAISLRDFAKGNIDVEAGYTPFVLTFDDGNKNNFNMIEKDGENIIDPDCAVGILEEYREKYPDFNLTASFYIYGTNPFRQNELVDYKLKFLSENGYEIGNHTWGHQDFTEENMNPQKIQSQLGKLHKFVSDKIENYDVNTLALPYGSKPNEEYYKYLVEGNYEGITYKNIAILNVGCTPSYSPYDSRINFHLLPRVRASEMNVDNLGIYDWLKYFENHPDRKFVSDGKPDIITIPKDNEENLNENLKEDKTIYTY